jgi:hypothetical protein
VKENRENREIYGIQYKIVKPELVIITGGYGG